ncbi:MAG: hypothetical protein HZB39_21640 [Planctomycetes bacterium]|nr:hypothetical protein [Planctomycetota bacterium]
MSARFARRALHPVLAIAVCGCTATPPSDAWFTPDLGRYVRPTSARSAGAQGWFDQGLLWSYGFNHAEAVRCFRAAQAADPDFALAWWGEAWALGPNINAPMDEAGGRAAFAAITQARALRAHASPVEQALIDALATRYADPPPADRAALDAGFVAAMRDTRRRFPDDPDVGAIFADAILNTRPWDYWNADGSPKEGTSDALDALRAVLIARPDHPGAHHFHIHVTESSPRPEDGLVSAQVLETLAPGAGHLVHMPAHTLHRLGRYFEAEEHNRRAIDVDRRYFRRAGPQGGYEFYLAHNHHFRAWSAMAGGRFAVARAAAQDLVADFPAGATTDFAAFTDGFFPTGLHVLLRFGRWDEVLATPPFADSLPIAGAMRHYARGIAFAATGRTGEARAEQAEFETAAARVGDDHKIGLNAAKPVLAIARAMLEGETCYREGRFDDAFAALRDGVAREDALRYDEPSPWMMPVRHALGALLLEQGKVAEAEQVYRDDLVRNRENGWALHGLAECLTKLGRTDEAGAVTRRFELAWAHADTPLEHGSCFCRGTTGEACCDAAAASVQVAVGATPLAAAAPAAAGPAHARLPGIVPGDETLHEVPRGAGDTERGDRNQFDDHLRRR